MLKTLHWYIIRELLRIFLLTTSVLTTLLAFGGTFKPLTKSGLGLLQLMHVLFYLIPAMLAYATPLAALFAAVLVYWRIATDNEVTGARANGISFYFLILPALLLGLTVGGLDLVLVDYVVPSFLQKSSRAIQSDITDVLLHSLGQHQPFQVNNLVVYADKAYPIAVPANDEPPPGAVRNIIQLQGLAATVLRDNRPTSIVLAKTANVIIDKIRKLNQVQVAVQLEDGTAFDPNSIRQIRGTIRYLPPDGKPYVIGSLLENEPKFFNNARLQHLRKDPLTFQPIAKLQGQLSRLKTFDAVTQYYLAHFKPMQPLTFTRTDGRLIVLEAPKARINKNHELIFSRQAAARVVVNKLVDGRTTTAYSADEAAMHLAADDAGSKKIHGAITLSGNILLQNVLLKTGAHAGPAQVVLGPLRVPTAAGSPVPSDALPPSPSQKSLEWQITHQVQHLRHTITSELQSRRSFALSCVILVLLGAALGLLLEGRNPLAVFVVGFVPAMLLVLLITTGRTMVERTTGSTLPGVMIIWLGNGVILMLNVFVYSKLLRK